MGNYNPLTNFWVLLISSSPFIHYKKNNNTFSKLIWEIAFHCTKNWSFPLRVFSINVTKSAVSCGFVRICWRNLQWESSFLVQCLWCFGITVIWKEIVRFNVFLVYISFNGIISVQSNFNMQKIQYLLRIGMVTSD